jgi:5-methylcytosine-specific restriction endonuclease McrA
VDHVTPKAKGGTDDMGNLAAICRDCHATKTAMEAAEAQGRTLKPRIRFDQSGFPVWDH